MKRITTILIGLMFGCCGYAMGYSAPRTPIPAQDVGKKIQALIDAEPAVALYTMVDSQGNHITDFVVDHETVVCQIAE